MSDTTFYPDQPNDNAPSNAAPTDAANQPTAANTAAANTAAAPATDRPLRNVAPQGAPQQLTGRASIEAGTHINGEFQATPAQKAAGISLAQPKEQTVQMEALRDGSFNGETYHTGETIDVPESHVEALTLSGFAARTDRAQLAQQARDEKAQDVAKAEADAKQKAETRAARRSTAVKPITTHDVPGAEPPKPQ